ncbi:hypothetical protein [Polaromonas hydrogenivorans]
MDDQIRHLLHAGRALDDRTGAMLHHKGGRRFHGQARCLDFLAEKVRLD